MVTWLSPLYNYYGYLVITPLTYQVRGAGARAAASVGGHAARRGRGGGHLAGDP